MLTSIVTGTNGQDGSYACEKLLKKGHFVYGVVRPSSSNTTNRLSYIEHKENFKLVYCDVTDTASIFKLVLEAKPDFIYNFAALSFVGYAEEHAQEVIRIISSGTHNFLDAIAATNGNPRFLNPCSSEIFGNAEQVCNETGIINPITAYGVGKALSYHLVRYYRQRYNIFACNAIAYNHTSPRQSNYFLAKKVCEAVAKIKSGLVSSVKLGDLNSFRSWGYAPDFVNGFIKLNEHSVPLDLVFSTGHSYRVLDFVETAFEMAGLDYRNHVILDNTLGSDVVKFSGGNPWMAESKLGWTASMGFKQLIELLVNYEINTWRLATSKQTSDLTLMTQE